VGCRGRLQIELNSQPQVVDHIDDIDDLYIKQKEIERKLSYYENKLSVISDQIRILQSICLHQNTVFSHHTYHDHYDECSVYKCNDCGALIE